MPKSPNKINGNKRCQASVTGVYKILSTLGGETALHRSVYKGFRALHFVFEVGLH
jgi:hypothetical protein